MKLIDVQELSQAVGVSPQKIREMCEAEIIPFYNFGAKTFPNYKFNLDEILVALKNRKPDKGE